MSPTSSSPPSVSATGAKLSVVAVLSLVFGLLGFTVIGGLVSILLGFIANMRISRSAGRLRGHGFAWTGIIMSAVWLLTLTVVVVGFVLPTFAKMQSGAMPFPGSGHDNLRRLNKAVRFYQGDNGGKFPPTENWCVTLRPLLGARAEQVLHRPGSQPNSDYGYGYNAAVAGLTTAELNAKTVVFFELETPAANAAGGEELLRHPTLPNDYVFVCSADGNIARVASTNLATLRWKP